MALSRLQPTVRAQDEMSPFDRDAVAKNQLYLVEGYKSVYRLLTVATIIKPIGANRPGVKAGTGAPALTHGSHSEPQRSRANRSGGTPRADAPRLGVSFAGAHGRQP